MLVFNRLGRGVRVNTQIAFLGQDPVGGPALPGRDGIVRLAVAAPPLGTQRIRSGPEQRDARSAGHR